VHVSESSSDDSVRPAADPERRLLVVAGSGRSGTSLVTGLCGRLGQRIPSPEVTADASNPHGFGEPRWAVEFHDRLLASICVGAEDGRPEAWEKAAAACERPKPRQRLGGWLTEQFDGADRVVVKDPRLGWFLPLYRYAAEDTAAELDVLTMLRHPAEAIRSRELAYGSTSPATTRVVSWLNMMLGTEARTRDLPRAFVSYDDLLTDWRPALAAAFGGRLLDGASEDQLAAAGALVDPGLRRAERSWDDLGIPADLRELAEATLAALHATRQGEDRTSELDELGERFVERYREAEQVALWSARGARLEARRAAEKKIAEAADAPAPPRRGLLGRMRR
jgi:hypothetical protein